MAENPEQFLIGGVASPGDQGQTTGLRLEPPIASSDWILLRGSVEVPPAKPAAGWLFGRRQSRANSNLFGASLQARLLDSEEPRDLTLGPGGIFETRFALNLPRVRGAKRRVRFTLQYNGHRTELSAPLFMPAPGATIGVVVLTQSGASTNHSAGVGLSEPSRELVRLLSSGGPYYESNPVFYFGLPEHSRAMDGIHREMGWPDGLAVANCNGDPPARAAVEQALWLNRLMELYANELEFVVIADTSSHSVAVLRAICRLKLCTGRLQAMLLSDTRPVARGVMRQAQMPAGVEDLDLPVVVCRTLDDARRAVETCGLIQVSGTCPPTPAAAVRRVSVAHTRVTRYPIVFCHGMLGYSVLRMEQLNLDDYPRGFRPFMTERGFRVLLPQLGKTHGIAQRAEQLRQAIGRWTSEPVNIIAHSAGGLDARYLISRLGMADRVVTLTTIATPHHGTYAGDWFVEHFDGKLPFLRGLERFGLDVDGFRDVTRAACRSFNEQVPDSPKVRYFSYSAFQVARKVPPVLRRTHSLIGRSEGANDGLVSEASAHWGEHIGTLRADHLALVGECPAEHFDHLALYLRIAEDLIRSGF